MQPATWYMTRVYWLLLSAMLLPAWLQAQSISASIYGRVLDSAGAIVPGATVRATHLDTETVYQFATAAWASTTFRKCGRGLTAWKRK